MPFARPTPAQIGDRFIAEAVARLPGFDGRTPRSSDEMLVRIMMLASHGLHGHLAWVAEQIHEDTAEAEILARQASIWGIARTPATKAVGSVAVTGTDGTALPAGAVWRRSDGQLYATTADLTLDGTSGEVALLAQAAGASGNCPAATPLTLVSPVAGVMSAAAVAEAEDGSGLSAGADEESDEDLRARVIERIQNPPHGGNARDYVLWARSVAGVIGVRIYPLWTGLGSVGVFFLMRRIDGSSPIPTVPEVAAVQAVLDLNRPVTATGVLALAPVALTTAFTLKVSPDTAAAKAAVTAAMDAYYAAEAAIGGTIELSRLSAAISAAAGEYAHKIVSPSAAIVAAQNQLPVRGAITWQAWP